MDEELKTDYKLDPLWTRAVEDVYNAYYGALGTTLTTNEEVFKAMDWSKSAGYPWNFVRMNTKKEVFDKQIRSVDNLIPFLMGFATRNYPATHTLSMKNELITVADRKAHKQRMYAISPVQLVIASKFLFYHQDQRLKNYANSRYGFCLFYSGVHSLFAGQIGKLNISYDESKWDKRFDVMKEVMAIRIRALRQFNKELPPWFEVLSNWVVMNNRFIQMLLPNGDVVYSDDHQNASGMDGTTTNNILGRAIRHRYVLLKSEYTPLPLVAPNTHMYGDDLEESPDPKNTRYLDPEWYDQTTRSINLVNKYRNVTQCVVGAEFLGFTVARAWWRPTVLVPKFRRNRILSGLYSITSRDGEKNLSRLIAYVLLSFPVSYDFYKSVVNLAVSFIEENINIDQASVALNFITNEKLLQYAFDGLESGGFLPQTQITMAEVEKVIEDEFQQEQ